MSHTLTYSFPADKPARDPSWSRTFRILIMIMYRPLRAMSRRAALRRARRELLVLPDSMLTDMGISRSEIPSVVRDGRPDPTRLPRGRV
jgi:uncharacterized protein YjiS (DUF1127 family)